MPLAQHYIVPHILPVVVMAKFQCFDEKYKNKTKQKQDKLCTEGGKLSDLSVTKEPWNVVLVQYKYMFLLKSNIAHFESPVHTAKYDTLTSYQSSSFKY